MQIRIASFNVLAQTWIDEALRKFVEARYLKRDFRIARQIDVLKSAQADVMLLQEVTPIVLGKFQEQIPNYEGGCFARMHWQPAKSGHPVNGNAILWRKGLFCGDPLCESIELDQGYGNYAAMVSGTLKEARKSIRFFNIHLEWGNPGIAAAQFHYIFERRFVRNHKRVVIGGDFNMGGPHKTAFPIIDDIPRYGFVDCAPQLRTHPFEDEESTITHILLRGLHSVSTGIVGEGAETINDCLRLYGSDHFPVVATVSI